MRIKPYPFQVLIISIVPFVFFSLICSGCYGKRHIREVKVRSIAGAPSGGCVQSVDKETGVKTLCEGPREPEKDWQSEWDRQSDQAKLYKLPEILGARSVVHPTRGTGEVKK